ncbi:hypothetical protein EXIGLDRAFT_525598 [Exidia glandulosa HHB12029]|uniref:Ribosome biogenesis protein SLX9 n=1 Tax=Exidia glandulosa HHB12029 TaxID=1314781 RepID=A0A165IZE1_EXIGL|nr:hypothetical protein EXIGLDRAFT_525598 [Exidia glandulosa HHB12029]
MPKERLKRTRQHAPSASLPTRKLAADHATEHVELGALADASGAEILSSLSAPDIEAPVSKKQKQREKHDAWMERLQASQAPYSKSHSRRLKRKAKESLNTDMNDMQAVLSGMEPAQVKTIADDDARDDDGAMDDGGERKKKPAAQTAGLIGEGKGQPLSKTQRKRALAAEAARHPLILSNPAFAANPFATIRTHVSNTLVKHDATQPPAS